MTLLYSIDRVGILPPMESTSGVPPVAVMTWGQTWPECSMIPTYTGPQIVAFEDVHRAAQFIDAIHAYAERAGLTAALSAQLDQYRAQRRETERQ